MDIQKHGAGFRIVGIVEKVFLAASGKFAKLTISCPGNQDRMQKVDVVAFSDKFDLVKNIGQGEEIRVTGAIAMEKLTNKAREEVKVDGYAKWSPMLVLADVTVMQQAAAPKAEDPAGW